MPPTPPEGPSPPNPSLMRSLGAFFGHIAKGISTDVTRQPAKTADEPDVREVRRTIEEEETPDGVVLRRTIIEEVELRSAPRTQRDQQADESPNDATDSSDPADRPRSSE